LAIADRQLAIGRLPIDGLLIVGSAILNRQSSSGNPSIDNQQSVDRQSTISNCLSAIANRRSAIR